MKRVNAVFLAPIVLISLLFCNVALTKTGEAQVVRNPLNERPGDELFTPTKLQWAALELQALYGNTNWTTETPVLMFFLPQPDGKTVLCVVQYTPDTTAELVKFNRDTAQTIFDKYVASSGWSWLRVKFDERVLHPGKAR